MFRPFKTLIFLTLVLCALLGLSWLAPTGGFRVGRFSLRYPGIDRVKQAVLGEAFSTRVAAEADRGPLALSPVEALGVGVPDSLSAPQPAGTVRGLGSAATRPVLERLKERLTPIEFADSGKAALKSFFTSLAGGEARTGQVRVMHFGDSQIEGDRVTMFIRSALQAQFGGNGVGIVPAYPQSYQPLNVRHSASGSWHYTNLHDGGSGVGRLGLLGGITRIEDGLSGETVEFRKVGGNSRSNRFRNLRILYGQNDSAYTVELQANGQAVDAGTLHRAGVAGHRLDVPEQSEVLRLQFIGSGPLEVYGISMESGRGVYVDNIPQRGSSGTVFTKFDADFSRTIFALLNVKLVILQYGVNLVPGNLDSYRYYEEMLYRQIRAIRAFKPDVSVLLIGVSDMSRRGEEGFETYPSVERVRNAQRNAAFRAGAAFWDCYTAMGGKNSMPEWVNASPALATKDFTHFNFRGAKLIAEMFTDALLSEYAAFQRKRGGR